MKCRLCGRRVKKHVNHRFNWVEEQLCGLCFWGRLFGYFNSLNGTDQGSPNRIVRVVAR